MTIHSSILNNNIRIATDEMQDVETVSVYVCVGVGSRMESKEYNGISHFLEHMAFKGTSKRNYQEIAETIDSIGGIMNAYTSKEATCYYIKLMKEDVEIAFDVLSDILQNSVFAEKEIEKEREVILQELAASNDTPSDVAFDIFGETAFSNQPLGRAILGSEENIKAFTRQDLINYIKTFYVNEKIVISVAGNITHQKTTELSNKYFSNYNNHFVSNNTIPPVSNYIGGVNIKRKHELEQVQFILGFNATSYLDLKQFYTTQIASAILGDGMSSRLFQTIREKLGLVYTVQSFGEYYNDNGIFGVYAGTNLQNLTKLLEAVIHELQSFVTYGIKESEMKKVSKQFTASLVMNLESVNQRAQRLGSNILKYNRYIENAEILNIINNITSNEVIEIMKKILQSNISLVCYGNITDEILNNINKIVKSTIFATI